MNGKIKNLDVEKLSEYLQDLHDKNSNTRAIREYKAGEYYNGYKDALSEIRQLFYDTNYENKKTESDSDREYREGANYALYKLCENLNIQSQDIRQSGDPVDMMCAALADRIRKRYQESGQGDT